jgi:methionyl-tRNA formyltransferase
MRHRLLVEEPTDLRAEAVVSRAAGCDLGIVISYGRLIPAELLRGPRYGMLGLHPSLLPKCRGANPVAWPILHGDATTGVTIFRLNERMDAGEIISQVEMAVAPRDTTETLSARLAQRGAGLLVEAVRRLEHGALTTHPQEERLATVSEKFTKAHGRIDWHTEAVAIDRLVRAVTPWPGAYTRWHQTVLKVWEAEPVSPPPAAGQAPPTAAAGQAGVVLEASAAGIVVGTGAGALRVRELQLAGKRRMTAAEFLAGHSLRMGEQLGDA